MSPLRFLLLLLLSLTLAAPVGGGVARAQEVDPAATALLKQEVLPQLDARQAAAQARAQAAQDWFDGKAQLAEAFPQLVGAPLDSLSYLGGQLQELDRAGVSRAADRVAAAPAGLSTADADRWRRALVAAVDAEERADLLRRRFLEGILAGHQRAPGLRAAATADMRASWRAERTNLPAEGEEGRAEALLRAAVSGDAEAALNRTLAAAWRHLTIPGDTTLVQLVDQDLAAPLDWQAAPLVAAARLDRLARVQPLLDAPQRDAIDQLTQAAELARIQASLPVLRTQVADLQAMVSGDLPAVSESPEDLQAALDAAQAALDALEPPSAALPDDASDDDKARDELKRLEYQRAVAVRDLAERRLDLGRTSAAEREAAAQSEAVVGEARQRAEDSLALAEQATNVQEAAIRKDLAELQSKVADTLELEQARHTAMRQALLDTQDRLAKARDDAQTALALPPLSVGRQGQIDSAYRNLRQLVADLRRLVQQSRTHLAEVRAAKAEKQSRLPDTSGLPDAVRESVQAEIDDAAAELTRILEQQETNALQEVDWAVELLSRTKRERRLLRPETSARAQDEMLATFMPELLTELSETPTIIRADLRNIWRTVKAIPSKVTDVNAIMTFLTHSFEIVLLGILWIGLRRNALGWSRRVLESLSRQQAQEGDRFAARRLAAAGWFVEGELRALATPLAPVLFAAVDISVAVFFFRMTRGPLTLLALLVLLWLARSIYKGAPALVDLVLAPPDSRRPALRIVTAERIAMVKRSVRVVVGVALVVYILLFISLDLFDADRLADIVRYGRTFAAVAVVIWLLSTWSTVIRSAVAASGETDRFTARLTATDDSVVLRLARAAGGAVYLLWRGAAELLVRIAEGRPGLGWLASALARARLRTAQDTPEQSAPLDAATRRELDAVELTAPHAEARQTIATALAAWQDERRRGMVAVIGDTGAGRSELLAAVDQIAEEVIPGIKVEHLVLGGRTHDPDAALLWLARLTGCSEEGVTEDKLVAELSDRPPQVYVVDDLQRLALRAVGGFGAVQAVLRVMQALSEEHFWVCGLHAATWNYLAGVTSAVNLEAFRARVLLKGLGSTELGAWVRERAGKAGYTLDFAGLLPGRAIGPEAQRAVERAEQAYWRLLADASMGIPEIAWGYVLGAARRSQSGKVLDIKMFEAPSTTDLEGLPDLDLFVLTAIVMHNDLDSLSIGDVLNAPQAQVQEACRHLDGLDVLDGDRNGSSWTIAAPWRPAVQRLLRQKHFLYMR